MPDTLPTTHTKRTRRKVPGGCQPPPFLVGRPWLAWGVVYLAGLVSGVLLKGNFMANIMTPIVCAASQPLWVDAGQDRVENSDAREAFSLPTPHPIPNPITVTSTMQVIPKGLRLEWVSIDPQPVPGGVLNRSRLAYEPSVPGRTRFMAPDVQWLEGDAVVGPAPPLRLHGAKPFMERWPPNWDPKDQTQLVTFKFHPAPLDSASCDVVQERPAVVLRLARIGNPWHMLQDGHWTDNFFTLLDGAGLGDGDFDLFLLMERDHTGAAACPSASVFSLRGPEMWHFFQSLTKHPVRILQNLRVRTCFKSLVIGALPDRKAPQTRLYQHLTKLYAVDAVPVPTDPEHPTILFVQRRAAATSGFGAAQATAGRSVVNMVEMDQALFRRWGAGYAGTLTMGDSASLGGVLRTLRSAAIVVQIHGAGTRVVGDWLAPTSLGVELMWPCSDSGKALANYKGAWGGGNPAGKTHWWAVTLRNASPLPRPALDLGCSWMGSPASGIVTAPDCSDPAVFPVKPKVIQGHGGHTEGPGPVPYGNQHDGWYCCVPNYDLCRFDARLDVDEVLGVVDKAVEKWRKNLRK